MTKAGAPTKQNSSSSARIVTSPGLATRRPTIRSRSSPRPWRGRRHSPFQHVHVKAFLARKTALNNCAATCNADVRQRIRGQPMKSLEILPSDRTQLYNAMIKKQAEIRRSERGTFSRARATNRNAARWNHVRYKGSINLAPGPSQAVEAVIRSPDRGDEARLLSSFLGWLDRNFGEHLSAVNIKYR